MGYELVGMRIMQNRLKRGFTREAFAEKVDLSINYVGDIERGKKTPSFETLIRIANVLEVSADDLLMDVIVCNYSIRFAKFFEKIETMTKEEKEVLTKAINKLIE